MGRKRKKLGRPRKHYKMKPGHILVDKPSPDGPRPPGWDEKVKENPGLRGLIPFQKGQVVKGAGTSRHSRINLTKLLREILERPDKTGHKTRGEYLMEVLENRARRGDIRHIKEIMDRIDGKVPDKLQVERATVLDQVSEEDLEEAAQLELGIMLEVEGELSEEDKEALRNPNTAKQRKLINDARLRRLARLKALREQKAKDLTPSSSQEVADEQAEVPPVQESPGDAHHPGDGQAGTEAPSTEP